MAEAVDVGESRQVAQRQRLVGEQRAGQQRQRGILRAGNRQGAGKAIAATDEDTVHAFAHIEPRARRQAARMFFYLRAG
ncbi:MAG: hypothetical protein P0Y64_09475 [Candidatus Sphingomonas colombiensis]|nr:hypothetical protein [Sphingomonas sp.]WEK45117.1 MAG: hypothetical protein P0Y64_09475 [Sphingomonas sp.]